MPLICLPVLLFEHLLPAAFHGKAEETRYAGSIGIGVFVLLILLLYLYLLLGPAIVYWAQIFKIRFGEMTNFEMFRWVTFLLCRGTFFLLMAREPCGEAPRGWWV